MLKCYNGKINTYFHNNKILRGNFQCICLSIILNNPFFSTAKNIVISTNFLVCKFCGKAQFFQQNCDFPQNFYTRKI